jgi:uncharacterized protein DUF222/HNH endonuclease
MSVGLARLEHVIECESQVALPEGLAEMPPGPRLAAALASVDRSRLCGFDLVVLLRARNRQIAYEQAELAADMVAVTACVEVESSGSCGTDIDRFAAAEIAAALTLTKRAASARLADAHWLIERLPGVWAALRAGSIDVPKARVFIEGTMGLEVEAARAVAARVLPEAPELTTGQLAYRLRRLVLETDPQSALRRYEEAVAERKVVRGANPDGTGFLSGCNLPIEQAAAADERLDALARAAKRAGDDRPMDVIRADVYLGLITGTWEGPSPVGRRGVVELTADLPTLMGLAHNAAELAGWGPVIADIARQIADRYATGGANGHPNGRMGGAVWRYSITDPFTGGLIHHGTTRPPAGGALPKRDPRRFPTPRQRAFVVARDRTCRGPGCRVPARRAEIDHRIAHADGGPTEVWNLDAKCTGCHDLKGGGWETTRNAYDETIWTSLLGHRYHVPVTPITPPRPLSIVEAHLLKIARRRT